MISRLSGALRIAMLVALFAVATAQPAAAHDCSSQADCEQTAGYNAVVALAGGALALAAGLFGNAVAGGGEAPADASADAPAARAKKRRGCCLGWFSLIAGLPVALLALALVVVGVL